MLRDFTKEEFDIIIQAGQSNSEGSGTGDSETPFAQSDNILYMNNDFTISKAAERVIGNNIYGDYSLSFATEYIKNRKLSENRKLLIIRSSVGGTGFCENNWTPEGPLFLRMIEMTKTALALNKNNKIIALLWHQGENEAVNNISESVHYNYLSTLIKLTRSEFNFNDMPFVCGDFVQQWELENIEKCKPIVSAMRKVCRDIGNAEFIETQEFLSNDQVIHNNDIIHFCRDSLDKMGVKYFKAFCNIIN